MDWRSLLPGRPLPLVMGILNVTPDSFSDGGAFFEEDAAVRRGGELAAAGADILDIGGESTRPSSYGPVEPVSAEEERRRTAPVVRRLAREISIPISIDTRRASVARAALDRGASIVNDVTAFQHDPEMAATVSASGAAAILMHLRGTDPRTMQADLEYPDLLEEVARLLAAAAERAERSGVRRERIALDPGLGFSKSPEQSLELLARLGELTSLGFPLVVGASRKGFVRKYSGAAGDASPASSLGGSLACALFAARAGASIVRVHDVGETVALLRAERTPAPRVFSSGFDRGAPEFVRMSASLNRAATAKNP